MHALLAIWAKYPGKRHRAQLSLLALRFQNEADVGFIDGSRHLAEKVAGALADKNAVSPEAEVLADDLLTRYNASPLSLVSWQRQAKGGQAPYFEGLSRSDMAFAMQPWLEARLGCQAPWGRVAARKSLALKRTFYQLLRYPWDQEWLAQWLTANHTPILAAVMGVTVRRFAALQEASAALAEEEAQAQAMHACDACGDQLDLLRPGDVCRLCGNKQGQLV